MEEIYKIAGIGLCGSRALQWQAGEMQVRQTGRRLLEILYVHFFYLSALFYSSAAEPVYAEEDQGGDVVEEK